MKDLLGQMKRYIEHMEMTVDGEWGESRGLDRLITDNEMPDLYFKIIEKIDELEG